MDILFVASWYPSKLKPELGNFVQRHAEAVKAAGANLKVIHIGFSNRVLFPKIEEENVEGIHTVHLFLPRIGSESPFLIRYWSRTLIKKIHQNDFDPRVVHCHVAYPSGDFAIQIAEYLKTPLVYTEHWSRIDPTHFKPISPQIENRIAQVVAKSRFVLPVSHYLANLMRERGFTGNYRVINNAVNTRYFFPLSQSTNEPYSFLHISNFVPGIKNVEGILKAFSKVKNSNSELTIAGDGDLNRLKRHCENEAIPTDRIRFLGLQTYREVAELYQQSDSFVLFSNYEMLGCVVAEAHCCGLPVITSKVGGVPEMVDSSNGMLVEPGNIEMLASTMDRMIGMHEKFDSVRISEKAQSRYGYLPIGKSLIKIYRNVLSFER